LLEEHRCRVLKDSRNEFGSRSARSNEPSGPGALVEVEVEVEGEVEVEAKLQSII
jgi:hypothetical protein